MQGGLALSHYEGQRSSTWATEPAPLRRICTGTGRLPRGKYLSRWLLKLFISLTYYYCVEWETVFERLGCLVGMLVRLLIGPTYRFSKEDEERVPESLGVYAIYDKDGEVIYVGRTKNRNLRERLFKKHLRGTIRTSAFRRNLSEELGLRSEEEITRYVAENCSFKFLVVNDGRTRMLFEHLAIAALGPRLNKG